MDTFSKLKVLVIGEAMLDRYLKGAANRLSQEAPVQVVNVSEKEDLPGGAANTAANIRSLGAEPLLLSVVGDDEEGKSLREALKTFGISDHYILSDPARETLAKQRVLANGQMMIRFDQGSTEPLSQEIEARFIRKLRSAARKADAIIISDYNYGILTHNVLRAIAFIQQRTPKILVVDAKKYKPYQELRVTAVKPNYGEAVKLLKLDKKSGSEARASQMEKYGNKILELAKAQIAAITLDEDGALILERGQPPYRIYARPAEHNRVAGAGDTFISTLALALAAGAETPTAAELASAGASIVVEKPGTSTCYIEELKAYFSGEEKYISDSFHMSARVTAYRRQGKRIIFTNGCFDILHSGHIQYLNQAKAFGDVLIVGINSDDGVRRLKGPDRPINPMEDRAQVLAALSCVDHIIPFEEDVPFSLIQLIQPEVYVKGGDYTRETLPEAKLVEKQGGKVTILPYIQSHSTSGIIERIRQVYSAEAPNKEPRYKSSGQKQTIRHRKAVQKETAGLE
jgi:D-beta-D-heptose 7-phosphate kinase/D-beta-D-heptose 1-phosphate adenosyltransferase